MPACYTGNVAVMTSGGDAPGMNPALRAIVRRALVLGIKVFAIMEGYAGLLAGASSIISLKWFDVSGLLPKGGTIIGTSRSDEFRTFEGRNKAVYNLLDLGIDRLICIGGDGSLTGANILVSEWSKHLDVLVNSGKIQLKFAQEHPRLCLVGLVGSIDNDFCGTDYTIGTDSALHRIVDACDCIMTTASSHHRTFIIEVMGRNCGYLAASTALAIGADYAFIPEDPTSDDDWTAKMYRAIQRGRELGRRQAMIIIAEGAQDNKGVPIKSENVRELIEKNLGYDTRVTILGHVQRGGAPSALDRLLATRMGIEALNCILEPGFSESVVIGIIGDNIVRNPLMETVKTTKSISGYIAEHKYTKALELRGPDFYANWDIFKTLAKSSLKSHPPPNAPAILIMNFGAPASGMNSVVRALVRLSIIEGYAAYGVYEGCNGLIRGSYQHLKWIDVDGWSNIGGSLLGTNRDLPTDLESCALHFGKLGAKALFIVGGWEGYTCAMRLHEASETYPTLKIPIICIPATISNNCPGTSISIGSDTALNCIIDASDRLKISAVASRCRVFVMEIHGGKCGYLVSAAAIAGGAHSIYIPEIGISLDRLIKDSQALKARFSTNKTMALILNTEQSNSTYTTEIIEKILNEEGSGIFQVRKLILGHIQQGNSPSSYDRILGSKFSVQAFRTVNNWIKSPDSQRGDMPIGGVGLLNQKIVFVPMKDLKSNMDFTNRRPLSQAWMHLLEVSLCSDIRRFSIDHVPNFVELTSLLSDIFKIKDLFSEHDLKYLDSEGDQVTSTPLELFHDREIRNFKEHK